MLKFKYIFTSFLFVLLVGMNSHARSFVAESEVVENSTDSSQSEKESEGQESGEIITDLDFFGAFSLVNVQLQWRDLTADLNTEDADSDESWNPKEVFVDGVEFLSQAVANDVLPAPAVLASNRPFILLSTFNAPSEETVHTIHHTEQSVRTIVYIQNCGTYPKS